MSELLLYSASSPTHGVFAIDISKSRAPVSDLTPDAISPIPQILKPQSVEFYYNSTVGGKAVVAYTRGSFISWSFSHSFFVGKVILNRRDISKLQFYCLNWTR